jgi:hypothetical protein
MFAPGQWIEALGLSVAGSLLEMLPVRCCLRQFAAVLLVHLLLLLLPVVRPPARIACVSNLYT